MGDNSCGFINENPVTYTARNDNSIPKQCYSLYFCPEIARRDGYVYFKTEFEMLAYKPEINELTYGIVANTSTIGAFINIGVIDGLTHITQVGMEGFEFNNNQLISKDGKTIIKPGDKVKARIIAVSYKEKIPKVGLTMRQPGLGKIE